MKITVLNVLIIVSFVWCFAGANPRPDDVEALDPLISTDVNTKSSRLWNGLPRKRTGKFFGLTTGALGNNLQLGLSFIVPFLNIPIGGGTTTSPNYYGTTSDTSGIYGTGTGTGTGTTSLLGLNSNSVIFALIIGLGAVILIPLFIYSFTGVSTSPYGRSDDIPSVLTNLAATVDEAILKQFNVDAQSCLQRAICSHISSSSKKVAEGSAGSIEKIIDGITTNSYVNSLLSGTKVQEAIAVARKSGATCSKYMAKCPYSFNSINRSLAAFAENYIVNDGGDTDELDYSSNDIEY